MRVIADTNILLRATIGDDPEQARIARELLGEAELVAMPLAALCEFVWVSRSAYRRPLREIAEVIRAWVISATVELDQPAVEAGLTFLDASGDFADGVIAFTGRQLGGAIFTSFDRRAVELVTETGGEARLLA